MLVSVSMLNMALPPEDTPCPLKGLRHLWLLVSRGARVNLSPLTHSPGTSASGRREWPVSLGPDFEMDVGPGWIPHLHPSPIAVPFWSWPCPGSG